MERIQAVARRTKLNRSQLKRPEIQELEERDRKGYETLPTDTVEAARWEADAAWPKA